MEVKDRILVKAADLFCRYGIRTITMDEIASQLGISKKTIYQFFTDKDDMVSAVIDQEISHNEMECNYFRDSAKDAVQQIFLKPGFLFSAEWQIHELDTPVRDSFWRRII